MQLRLEKNAKKRKAPEYGALVVSTAKKFVAKAMYEFSGLCSMAVHRALKRCTVCRHCTKQMWELACLRWRCVSPRLGD